jgi:hypothetical protein
MATYEPIGSETRQTHEGNGRHEIPQAERERRRDEAVEGSATLGTLFRQLTNETAAFVQAEMTLARREANEKLDHAKRGAVALAAGAVIAGLGLWALVATMIWAIAIVLPLWAAALITAGTVLCLGGIAALIGRKYLQTSNFEPERTIRSLRSTRDMAKEHLR